MPILNREHQATARFWTNKAFRRQVVNAAKAEGRIPQSVDPENLKTLLKFIIELLPFILKFFV